MATRSRIILIAVGVLILLIVAAQITIPRLLNTGRFRAQIESALSHALARKVALGSLDLSFWSGSLVAHNVSIAEDPAFGDQPFLRAPSVKIRVALNPLIFRGELRIEGFDLVAPQIMLLRAGNGTWNFSSIGRASQETGGTQAGSGTKIPNFTASRFDVSNGTVNVGSTPGSGPGLTSGLASATGAPHRVYSGLNLEGKNFSFDKAFPFTASARFPGAGSLSIGGNAGPLNPRDILHTPFTAHAGFKHLDLAAAGVLKASSGITGQIEDISIDATWNGRSLHVRNLLIDAPKLAIDRAAVAELRGEHPGAHPRDSIMSRFSVASIEVKDGTITAVAAGQPASGPVYNRVNLTVSNYSPKTSSPFTLSSELPGGGSLDLSGNVGPVDWQDFAGTRFDAEIALKRADLTASPLIPLGSGIAGLLSLDARAASDGRALNANGVARVERLRLAKTAPPSPQSVDIRFAETQNIGSHSGQIQHSTVTVGSAVLNVEGTYHTAGGVPEVNLKAEAPSSLVDQIQAFLPALGVKLPSGSRLQGGTFTASFNITGPFDHPVIDGPLQLENTELAGFDLGSKLAGIAALVGLHPGSDTAIGSLSLNLHAADRLIRTDNVVLEIPSLGSVTGNGTIEAGGALDYHLILKPTALGGGPAGAKGSGGLLAQLMNMFPGAAGKAIGGLESSVLKSGIPVVIGGTASNPTFAPNLSGMASE